MSEAPATIPEMDDPAYPEWERATDQVCLDWIANLITTAEARERLISLGMDAGIVDDGLAEHTGQRSP